MRYESKSTFVSGAIESTDTATDISVSDFWFPPIAQGLLGRGAGEQLAALTDFDARTCWRYAPKDRATRPIQPPGFFIVCLLRSEQGASFLNAFMDGSNPKWWSEFQSVTTRAAEAEQKLRAIGSILSS